MEQSMLSALRRLNRIIALLVGVLLLGCVVFMLADIVLRQVGSSLGGGRTRSAAT